MSYASMRTKVVETLFFAMCCLVALSVNAQCPAGCQTAEPSSSGAGSTGGSGGEAGGDSTADSGGSTGAGSTLDSGGSTTVDAGGSAGGDSTVDSGGSAGGDSGCIENSFGCYCQATYPACTDTNTCLCNSCCTSQVAAEAGSSIAAAAERQELDCSGCKQKDGNGDTEGCISVETNCGGQSILDKLATQGLSIRYANRVVESRVFCLSAGTDKLCATPNHILRWEGYGEELTMETLCRSKICTESRHRVINFWHPDPEYCIWIGSACVTQRVEGKLNDVLGILPSINRNSLWRMMRILNL
jgi:hypothetical protein